MAIQAKFNTCIFAVKHHFTKSIALLDYLDLSITFHASILFQIGWCTFPSADIISGNMPILCNIFLLRNILFDEDCFVLQWLYVQFALELMAKFAVVANQLKSSNFVSKSSEINSRRIELSWKQGKFIPLSDYRKTG